MAKRGAEVGDVKNEEGRADSEPMSQRSNVGDEQQVNDMQGVMLHSSNTGITQELEDVSDLSYGIGATTTQSCVRMEPKEISITQLLQHEVLFVMVFPEALPNHVKDAYASFGDMPAVQLKKKNDFNLIGAVPASLKPGKVKVRVTSSAGDHLGETWFQCLDEMLDMFERLKGDPDLQRSFFTLWNHTTPECTVSKSGYDGDDEDSSSDSSDNGNQEPMRKRGDVGDDQQVSEMERVMLYSGDTGINQELGNLSTPSSFLCRVNEQEPDDTCRDRPEIGPDDPQQDPLSVGESLQFDQHPSAEKTGRSEETSGNRKSD